jgi:hypothetical protein
MKYKPFLIDLSLALGIWLFSYFFLIAGNPEPYIFVSGLIVAPIIAVIIMIEGYLKGHWYD